MNAAMRSTIETGRDAGVRAVAARRFLTWRFGWQSLMAFTLICLAVPGAGAAEKLGEAAAIENTVTGKPVEGKVRRLAVSSPVFGAELISAGANSHGELRLNDNSLVIVGENSAIALDDFVASGDGFSAATLNVAKGAFRFITGKSPKKAFRIQTPLANIGVRGTIFDVYVDPVSKHEQVVLFRGAVRVCTTGAHTCVLASRACDIIEVRSPTQIGKVPFLRSRARPRAEEAAAFGLSERQQRFQRRWRAPTGVCSARAALEAQPSGSGTGKPSPSPSSGRGQEKPG